MTSLLIPNWFDELPLIAKMAIITAVVLYFVGGFVTYAKLDDEDVFYDVEPTDKDIYMMKVMLLWWVYLPKMTYYMKGYQDGLSDGEEKARRQRQYEMEASIRKRLEGVDIEELLENSATQ